MNIIAVSDTHGDLEWVNWLIQKKIKSDILIHAGDATSQGGISSMARFFEATEKLIKKGVVNDIVFVPGNHELGFERQEKEYLERFSKENIHILINNFVIIDGIKIWGSPVTPPFFNWAWNWRDEQREALWETIPEDTDIIVTHGPSYGIGDLVINQYHSTPERVGCKFMASRIKKLKPKAHIFGHIHCDHGMWDIDDTTYVNASIMSEEYKPANKPTFLTIQKRLYGNL